MIQAEVPFETSTDETETVRVLLSGLINHSTYGTAAEHMFPTNLPETVEKVRERIENHTLMMAQKTSETRYRGMAAASPNGRLADDLYQSINKILYHRLNSRDANTNQNHNYNKRNMRGRTGYDKRVKDKSPDQHR